MKHYKRNNFLENDFFKFFEDDIIERDITKEYFIKDFESIESGENVNYDFAIISPCKGEADKGFQPSSKPNSFKFNKKQYTNSDADIVRVSNFEKWLLEDHDYTEEVDGVVEETSRDYDYAKIIGMYGHPEISYIIKNISLGDANNISKDYQQDGFIFYNHILKTFSYYCFSNKQGRYVETDRVSYRELEVMTGVTAEGNEESYASYLHTTGGFRINFSNGAYTVESVLDIHEKSKIRKEKSELIETENIARLIAKYIR